MVTRTPERRAADHPTPERRRGRPAKPGALVTWVTFRMSLEQKRKLEGIAKINGQSVQDFLREAATEAIADCSDEDVFDKAS